MPAVTMVFGTNADIPTHRSTRDVHHEGHAEGGREAWVMSRRPKSVLSASRCLYVG